MSASGSVTPVYVTTPPIAVDVMATPPLMASETTVPFGASVLSVTFVTCVVVNTAIAAGLVNASAGGLPTVIVHMPSVDAELPAGSVAVSCSVVTPVASVTLSKVAVPPVIVGPDAVSVVGVDPVCVRVSVAG